MDVVEVLARVLVLLKGITRNKYFHAAKFRARKSWLWGLTITIKDILGLMSTFARFCFLGSGGGTLGTNENGLWIAITGQSGESGIRGKRICTTCSRN